MITNIPIKNLKLLDRNPRHISKEQFEKLCNSLKEDEGFLKCRPILVNKVNGELIVYAGNQRVRAAKKIGWKSISCNIEEDLSEELMNSRLLKDNAHYGTWDYEILSSDFDVDLLFDVGFTDISLLGEQDNKDNTDNTKEELKEKIENLGIEQPDPSHDPTSSQKKKKDCPNCGYSF